MIKLGYIKTSVTTCFFLHSSINNFHSSTHGINQKLNFYCK